MKWLLALLLVFLAASCTVSERSWQSNQEANLSNANNPLQDSDSPSIAFDVPATSSWDLGPYAQIVQQRVQSNWRIPASKDSAKLKAWVGVKFVINKDGSISDIVVSHSSGDKILDKASIDALKSSSPLPPLPPEVTLPHISGNFKFYYNMPVPR